MKILITGAAGFVGSQMIPFFLDRGHEIIGVDHNPPPEKQNSMFRYIKADTTGPGEWQLAVAEADAVINLAGKNIFGRWNEATKRAILESRVKTTRNIVDAISGAKEAVLCNASAVGFYGDKGDDIIREDALPGNDFLAEVAVAWEKEASRALDKGVRVVLMRFALVMGKTGGALPTMLPAFKSFVGGPMGSGMHFMPWIHISDLMRAFVFVLDRPDIEGPVNCSAPNPVRNMEFARVLGSVLNRPALLRLPAFALRLIMGELGALMLESQRAIPAKLIENGFTFEYPRLEEALSDLLR